MFTLNCRNRLLVAGQPLIMGIINITPDSFYSNSRWKDADGALQQAELMLQHGADVLDIGGQSTRPGSERISAEDELSRLLPVISAIHCRFPDAILSVDTYYAKVAREAVEAGASIVNDIGAGRLDAEMIPMVASLGTPYICMHMQGMPDSMQANPQYENVVREVLDFFIAKTEECRRAGIHDVIIDPGFGFGKSIAHNFELLKHLPVFGQVLQKPLLAGLSRKSPITRTLGVTAAEALNGTTALNMVALLNGASILRVHDVKEAKEVITLYVNGDLGNKRS